MPIVRDHRLFEDFFDTMSDDDLEIPDNDFEPEDVNDLPVYSLKIELWLKKVNELRLILKNIDKTKNSIIAFIKQVNSMSFSKSPIQDDYDLLFAFYHGYGTSKNYDKTWNLRTDKDLVTKAESVYGIVQKDHRNLDFYEKPTLILNFKPTNHDYKTFFNAIKLLQYFVRFYLNLFLPKIRNQIASLQFNNKYIFFSLNTNEFSQNSWHTIINAWKANNKVSYEDSDSDPYTSEFDNNWNETNQRQKNRLAIPQSFSDFLERSKNNNFTVDINDLRYDLKKSSVRMTIDDNQKTINIVFQKYSYILWATLRNLIYCANKFYTKNKLSPKYGYKLNVDVQGICFMRNTSFIKNPYGFDKKKGDDYSWYGTIKHIHKLICTGTYFRDLNEHIFKVVYVDECILNNIDSGSDNKDVHCFMYYPDDWKNPDIKFSSNTDSIEIIDRTAKKSNQKRLKMILTRK